MNEKFITEVLQLTIECWDSDQIKCKQFDCGLRMLLHNYKEMEESCTERILKKVICNTCSSFLCEKTQKENLTGH